KPAGGSGTEGSTDWHGNAVMSAAAAPVNNNRGAAGAGGLLSPFNTPLVVPVAFKTNRNVSEVFRCLQLCVAWGIGLINMSFTFEWPKILLPISGHWDDNFQFAADQGVITVASAGNNGSELPDFVVLPATRTPGTVTVGALDWNLTSARGDSNYGSSV